MNNAVAPDAEVSNQTDSERSSKADLGYRHSV